MLWTLAHICVLLFILATKRGNLVWRQNVLNPLHLLSVIMALLLHLKGLHPHLADLSLLL